MGRWRLRRACICVGRELLLRLSCVARRWRKGELIQCERDQEKDGHDYPDAIAPGVHLRSIRLGDWRDYGGRARRSRLRSGELLQGQTISVAESVTSMSQNSNTRWCTQKIQ